jgi:hypothetical protein
MLLFFLLIIFSHYGEAAMWIEANMKEMSRMKQCFHPSYAALIDQLFPPHAKESLKRQSQALDTIGRRLKLALPFCVSLREAVFVSTRYIEDQIVLDKNESAVWQALLPEFVSLGDVVLQECAILQKKLSPAEHQRYEGLLSETATCIHHAFRSAALNLIAAQYAEEEAGLKGF